VIACVILVFLFLLLIKRKEEDRIEAKSECSKKERKGRLERHIERNTAQEIHTLFSGQEGKKRRKLSMKEQERQKRRGHEEEYIA
jgi:signal transduction histidine kinase